MATERETDRPASEIVFAHFKDTVHAEVLEQTLRISAHSEAIRELEAVTRQVESPYIGSYLSA